MKRFLCAALGMALLAVSAPGHASAQIAINVSGGPTFPVSDYGDLAKTGWMAFAGLTVPVGESGAMLGATGFFGSNNHELDGDKTNLYGGLGAVGYAVDTGTSAMPYVFAGAGLMVHSYKSDTSVDESTNLFAAGGGAGLGFPIGSVQGALEAYVLNGFDDAGDTRLFGVSFGPSFPMGGGM